MNIEIFYNQATNQFYVKVKGQLLVLTRDEMDTLQWRMGIELMTTNPNFDQYVKEQMAKH